MLEFMPPIWVLGLLVAPSVLLLAWWAYRKPERPKRILMGVLRVSLLTLGIFLALGPFLRKNKTIEEPASLALLLDNSASLQRQDALAQDVLSKLADLGISTGPEPRRIDLLRALLGGEWRLALEQRYRLKAWSFSDRLHPTSTDGSGLSGEGQTTALAPALHALVSEHRGQHLPDVVLVSDGRANQGEGIESALSQFASEGSRIHVVALGDPRPAPDLALERIQAPDRVLLGDEALFLLRLSGSGVGLPEKTTVRLLAEDGTVLDQIEATPTETGTRLTLATQLFEAGEHLITAETPAIPSETARDNNRLTLRVLVEPTRIRVLYVEARPRYEYRYLKNRLLRSEKDMSVHCWLAEAGRDFQQEASPGTSRLRRIPTTVQELLEDFDVVILGDVDPHQLSPDPLDGSRFLDAVASFVERGGGLLMLAGDRSNPSAYHGTPLEPLLPVEISRESARSSIGFHAIPADAELPHPVVRLTKDLQTNLKLWQNSAELMWYQPVLGLRPGARAWLVHDSDTASNGQPQILAAGIYAPEGRVGWLGTDETWRWRDPTGERQPSRFWRSLLRHLASGRLEGDQGRARLEVNQSRIELGESVLLELRLRDEDFNPVVEQDGLTLFRESTGAPLSMTPVPGRPGVFHARFRSSELGDHSFLFTADGSPEGEILASSHFEVILPSVEMRKTSQNTELLSRITNRTGGMLVGPEAANDLLGILNGSERRVRTLASFDEPLDGRLLLSLFLVLACAEWFLRKRSNLS